MECFVIYGLADPRSGELRYVGKSTTGARQRLASHLTPSSLKANTHKNYWIRSLVRRGLRPEIFVIESFGSKHLLNEAERHQIAAFKMMGARLTNGTPGGDGIGVPCSPERRRKISASQVGRPKPKWTAERRARFVPILGRKRTPEQIEATAASRRGVPLKQHVRDAVVKGSRAFWASEENRITKSRLNGGRPFFDQTGRRFETQQGAARDLGISASLINRVLSGERKSTRGYVFTYAVAP